MRMITLTIAAALALGATTGPDLPVQAAPLAAAPDAERVAFRSMDDARTELVGYLFRPEGVVGKAPAVVLMHGRAGAYSSLADGTFNADTLTLRHKYWARYWASRGYYAIIVDGFGPRGYPGGFKAGTYSDRPGSINEVTVRPLDAYGALRYLRGLPGVDGDRIGLMGWSNGASAALAALADDKPGDMTRLGFRAALAFYPGCGLQRRFEAKGWKPYAPVLLLIGTDDEEVSPKLCAGLVKRSQGLGGAVEMVAYDGAAHSFDDRVRRSSPSRPTPRRPPMRASGRRRSSRFSWRRGEPAAQRVQRAFGPLLEGRASVGACGQWFRDPV